MGVSSGRQPRVSRHGPAPIAIWTIAEVGEEDHAPKEGQSEVTGDGQSPVALDKENVDSSVSNYSSDPSHHQRDPGDDCQDQDEDRHNTRFEQQERDDCDEEILKIRDPPRDEETARSTDPVHDEEHVKTADPVCDEVTVRVRDLAWYEEIVTTAPDVSEQCLGDSACNVSNSDEDSGNDCRGSMCEVERSSKPECTTASSDKDMYPRSRVQSTASPLPCPPADGDGESLAMTTADSRTQTFQYYSTRDQDSQTLRDTIREIPPLCEPITLRLTSSEPSTLRLASSESNVLRHTWSAPTMLRQAQSELDTFYQTEPELSRLCQAPLEPQRLHQTLCQSGKLRQTVSEPDTLCQTLSPPIALRQTGPQPATSCQSARGSLSLDTVPLTSATDWLLEGVAGVSLGPSGQDDSRERKSEAAATDEPEIAVCHSAAANQQVLRTSSRDCSAGNTDLHPLQDVSVPRDIPVDVTHSHDTSVVAEGQQGVSISQNIPLDCTDPQHTTQLRGTRVPRNSQDNTAHPDMSMTAVWRSGGCSDFTNTDPSRACGADVHSVPRDTTSVSDPNRNPNARSDAHKTSNVDKHCHSPLQCEGVSCPSADSPSDEQGRSDFPLSSQGLRDSDRQKPDPPCAGQKNKCVLQRSAKTDRGDASDSVLSSAGSGSPTDVKVAPEETVGFKSCETRVVVGTALADSAGVVDSSVNADVIADVIGNIVSTVNTQTADVTKDSVSVHITAGLTGDSVSAVATNTNDVADKSVSAGDKALMPDDNMRTDRIHRADVTDESVRAAVTTDSSVNVDTTNTGDATNDSVGAGVTKTADVKDDSVSAGVSNTAGLTDDSVSEGVMATAYAIDDDVRAGITDTAEVVDGDISIGVKDTADVLDDGVRADITNAVQVTSGGISTGVTNMADVTDDGVSVGVTNKADVTNSGVNTAAMNTADVTDDSSSACATNTADDTASSISADDKHKGVTVPCEEGESWLRKVGKTAGGEGVPARRGSGAGGMAQVYPEVPSDSSQPAPSSCPSQEELWACPAAPASPLKSSSSSRVTFSCDVIEKL